MFHLLPSHISEPFSLLGMFSFRDSLFRILSRPKRPSLKSIQSHFSLSPPRNDLLDAFVYYDYTILAKTFLLAGGFSTSIVCSAVTPRQYLLWLEELLLGSFLLLSLLVNFIEGRLSRSME
jgi:hypothetical protein